MDMRLKKMEQKLSGESELTDEARRQMRRAEKELNAQKKKEKREIKAAAKQSLDPGHWTKEILNADKKFSAKIEESIEDKLSRETIGLVTYEDMKAKKAALEEAAEEQKRKAEEEARLEKQTKKAKMDKGKGKLSFHVEDDE